MLSAYERNEDISIKEILQLPIEEGAKKSIRKFSEENPNASTLDLFQKFNIFDYPHFMPIATSTSKEELKEVYELLKEFRGFVLDGVVDLNDKMYNFMTNNKIKRKKEHRPGCFDGLCLEKNIEKIFPFAREAY